MHEISADFFSAIAEKLLIPIYECDISVQIILRTGCIRFFFIFEVGRWKKELLIFHIMPLFQTGYAIVSAYKTS